MKILETHNAIDEFNKLQNLNAELKTQLGEIEKHIENIKKNGNRFDKKQKTNFRTVK